MLSVALILPVRKNSQRVPNKMLRPFAGSTLFEIYLHKLRDLKEFVYVAAFEKDFVSIAQSNGFKVIQRNEESANGETSPIIHNYVGNLSEEFIFMVNACNPLMKSETLLKAMDKLEKEHRDTDFGGIAGVKECHEVIWNSNGKVVNRDAGLFNTKRREPNFINASSIFIFRKKSFIEHGVYWSFTDRDPELLVIDQLEATDIDTPYDFQVAEFLYKLNRID